VRLILLAAFASQALGAVKVNYGSNFLSYVGSVVVFGDSLSDNGNGAWGLTDCKWPPSTVAGQSAYFQGHYTESNVWVEYLAKEHKVPLYNYATGGATTGYVPGAVGKLSDGPTAADKDSVNSTSVADQIKQFFKDFPAPGQTTRQPSNKCGIDNPISADAPCEPLFVRHVCVGTRC